MLTRSLLQKSLAATATLASLLSCTPVYAQTTQPVSWAEISGFRMDISSINPRPESISDFNSLYCSGVGAPSGQINENSPGPGAEFEQPLWDRKNISTAYGSLSLELPSPRRADGGGYERGFQWSDGRVVQHYSIVSNTQFRFGPLIPFPMNVQNESSCGLNREYRLNVEKRSLKEIEQIFNQNAEARIRERRITRANTMKPIKLSFGNKNAMILPVYLESVNMYTYGEVLVEYKKGIVAHFSKEVGAAYPGADTWYPEMDYALLRIAESVR